jgi:hypothetical protein
VWAYQGLEGLGIARLGFIEVVGRFGQV